MGSEHRSRRAILRHLTGMVIVVAAVCCMCGCTTTKYVPVESVHEVLRIDTVYEAVSRTDSVVERDSVRTYVSGDTVLVEKVKWRVRVKNSVDTVYKTRIRVDSVHVDRPFPVEKELTRWQRTKMDFGGVAVGLSATMLILLIMLAVYKFKHKK